MRQYKIFFIVVVAVVLFVLATIWYVQSVVAKRGYEVTIEGWVTI